MDGTIDNYIRRFVVRAASVLLAYAGFILSLLAIVLSPLIQRAIAASAPSDPPLPLKHPARNSTQSTSESAFSSTSQPTSDASTSGSSDVISPLARLTVRAPRSSSQRRSSLPVNPDYFSATPWEVEEEEEHPTPTTPTPKARTAPAPGTSSPASIPATPPPAPRAIAPKLTTAATDPLPLPSTSASTSTPPSPFTPPPLLRPKTSLALGCPRSKSPGFRIPSLKRSWTAQQKAAIDGKSATRAVTSPADIALLHADASASAIAAKDPTLRRGTSTSAMQQLSSPSGSGSEGDEKTLRKSMSTPEGGLVSKWKVHRRRHPPTKLSAPPDAHAAAPASPSAKARACASPPVSPSPPQRTQPYSAPYYFPPPGSPEAVDYVRLAREDRLAPRVVAQTSRAPEYRY